MHQVDSVSHTHQKSRRINSTAPETNVTKPNAHQNAVSSGLGFRSEKQFTDYKEPKAVLLSSILPENRILSSKAR